MPLRTPFAPLLATLLLAGLVTDAAAATAPQATASAQPTAAADKVYPPLPSLAMLPPSDSNDDDPLPAPGGASRKKHGHAIVRVRQVTPAVKLIVTDASRAYLQDIEKQLDAALAK
jgi:hypothetical protein